MIPQDLLISDWHILFAIISESPNENALSIKSSLSFLGFFFAFRESEILDFI
jgi:hypothetical protein